VGSDLDEPLTLQQRETRNIGERIVVVREHRGSAASSKKKKTQKQMR